MTEVRVQCICTAIRLPDLGEKLFRGDILFLPKDKADKSKDLAAAKQNRAVVCREVLRCQEERPAVPPPNVPERPPVPPVPPTPPRNVRPYNPPKVDREKLARQMAERVARALAQPVVVVVPPVKSPEPEDIFESDEPVLVDEGAIEELVKTPRKKRSKKENPDE